MQREILGLLLALASANVSAVVIYDFAGTCSSGCVGTATAVLTLADTYTPNTAVASADFISFTYSSSSGTFEMPLDGALNRFDNGVLPLSFGPSVSWVEIDATGDGTGLNACGSTVGDPSLGFCPSAFYWSMEWRPLHYEFSVQNCRGVREDRRWHG